MLKRFFVVAVLIGFATMPASTLQAQKKTDPPKKTDSSAAETKAAPTKAGEPKKYDDVIPKTAKSFPGVFTVHKVDEKIYFEIPQDAFHKLMLWQAEVVKGPACVTWGGY